MYKRQRDEPAGADEDEFFEPTMPHVRFTVDVREPIHSPHRRRILLWAEDYTSKIDLTVNGAKALIDFLMKAVRGLEAADRADEKPPPPKPNVAPALPPGSLAMPGDGSMGTTFTFGQPYQPKPAE